MIIDMFQTTVLYVCELGSSARAAVSVSMPLIVKIKNRSLSSRCRTVSPSLRRWATSNAPKPPIPGSSKQVSEPEKQINAQEQPWKSSPVPSSQIARLLHYGSPSLFFILAPTVS